MRASAPAEKMMGGRMKLKKTSLSKCRKMTPSSSSGTPVELPWRDVATLVQNHRP